MLGDLDLLLTIYGRRLPYKAAAVYASFSSRKLLDEFANELCNNVLRVTMGYATWYLGNGCLTGGGYRGTYDVIIGCRPASLLVCMVGLPVVVWLCDIFVETGTGCDTLGSIV